MTLEMHFAIPQGVKLKPPRGSFERLSAPHWSTMASGLNEYMISDSKLKWNINRCLRKYFDTYSKLAESVIKIQLFWEGNKNLLNLPRGLDIYLVSGLLIKAKLYIKMYEASQLLPSAPMTKFWPEKLKHIKDKMQHNEIMGAWNSPTFQVGIFVRGANSSGILQEFYTNSNAIWFLWLDLIANQLRKTNIKKW